MLQPGAYTPGTISEPELIILAGKLDSTYIFMHTLVSIVPEKKLVSVLSSVSSNIHNCMIQKDLIKKNECIVVCHCVPNSYFGTDTAGKIYLSHIRYLEGEFNLPNTKAILAQKVSQVIMMERTAPSLVFSVYLNFNLSVNHTKYYNLLGEDLILDLRNKGGLNLCESDISGILTSITVKAM